MRPRHPCSSLAVGAVTLKPQRYEYLSASYTPKPPCSNLRTDTYNIHLSPVHLPSVLVSDPAPSHTLFRALPVSAAASLL